MNADQIGSLQPALAALLRRFRPFFFRRTTFEHGHRYLAGLMADLQRKSIEPIALAAGVPVRTLQEFLAFCVRGEERVGNGLQQLVVDEQGCDQAIAPRSAPIWNLDFGLFQRLTLHNRLFTRPTRAHRYCPTTLTWHPIALLNRDR